MKKIFLIACLIAFALGSQAQTSPRFGTTAHSDNTGRVATYKYVAPAYASTYAWKPSASHTFIKMGALTGALTINATDSSLCKVGDEATFMFLCDTLTAGRVVTFGTNMKTSGTLTVATSKRAAVKFVFDGIFWVACGREKE